MTLWKSLPAAMCIGTKRRVAPRRRSSDVFGRPSGSSGLAAAAAAAAAARVDAHRTQLALCFARLFSSYTYSVRRYVVADGKLISIRRNPLILEGLKPLEQIFFNLYMPIAKEITQQAIRSAQFARNCSVSYTRLLIKKNLTHQNVEPHGPRVFSGSNTRPNTSYAQAANSQTQSHKQTDTQQSSDEETVDHKSTLHDRASKPYHRNNPGGTGEKELLYCGILGCRSGFRQGVARRVSAQTGNNVTHCRRNSYQMNDASCLPFELTFDHNLTRKNNNYCTSKSGHFTGRKRSITGISTLVSGYLHNTGQFLVFRADKDLKVRVNITGGPLAYHYQFEEIYIHYGQDDNHGSEHRVNNYAFPAETDDGITTIDIIFRCSRLTLFSLRILSLGDGLEFAEFRQMLIQALLVLAYTSNHVDRNVSFDRHTANTGNQNDVGFSEPSCSDIKFFK
ncbi:unnamed protein product [Trichogramma brassicae]|uniref:Alpha-carbonic anhydrase domain-containing protein n=1 Tax=Trichogramma brassicae TaxID=86971 RepID=A0A6H5IUK3_9HYME|nr:unnamed protein product [Trichogramma brassicae]